MPAWKASPYRLISFHWNQWDNSKPSIMCKKRHSVCGLFMPSEEKHIENPFKMSFNTARVFLLQLRGFVQYAKASYWSHHVVLLFPALKLKSVILYNIAPFTMPNGLIPLRFPFCHGSVSHLTHKTHWYHNIYVCSRINTNLSYRGSMSSGLTYTRLYKRL